MQREREELQVMNISCPEGFSCKLGFKQLYDSCKIMFCKAQEIHRAEIPFDHQILRLVVYPMIFRFSYILGGFSLDFSHQPATSPPPG